MPDDVDKGLCPVHVFCYLSLKSRMVILSKNKDNFIYVGERGEGWTYHEAKFHFCKGTLDHP